MNVLSVGFNDKIFDLTFCQRELKSAIKVSQPRKNCEQSSISSLQRKQNAPLVPQNKGTAPFKP